MVLVSVFTLHHSRKAPRKAGSTEKEAEEGQGKEGRLESWLRAWRVCIGSVCGSEGSLLDATAGDTGVTWDSKIPRVQSVVRSPGDSEWKMIFRVWKCFIAYAGWCRENKLSFPLPFTFPFCMGKCLSSVRGSGCGDCGPHSWFLTLEMLSRPNRLSSVQHECHHYKAVNTSRKSKLNIKPAATLQIWKIRHCLYLNV